MSQTMFRPTALQQSKVFATAKADATIDYQMVTYLKYDHACYADEVKKGLEKHYVETYLSQYFHLEEGELGNSLDIGCATGRYPTWFASLGFASHGYDIEELAIEVCKERAQNSYQIHYERRDILLDGVVEDHFNLVTCMMGTLNHIPSNNRPLFFQRIAQTLKKDGLLFFSSWNPSCSYTNYLQFYNREERELLQLNAPRIETIEEQLRECGLELVAVEPFVFLPDECYLAWEAEVGLEEVIHMDTQLRGTLSNRNSQMYLVIAKKANQNV